MRRATFVSLIIAALLVGLASIAIASAGDEKKTGKKEDTCPVKTTRADGKPAVTNKLCPVTGEEASDTARTEYKGQYVYFCCEHCIAKFNKDPEKYVAKLSAEDREAIKANDKCPITGEAINKSVFTEHEGRKIYFCCQGCLDKFKKQAAEKKAS